jgi:hypothetical protein
MREAIIIPTYKRPELLYCCLERLRAQDNRIYIYVFSDRGHTSKELEATCGAFDAGLIFQGRHDYHGNSFNAGEALRFAYSSEFDLVHYIEDDVMAKPDLLAWTRVQHERFEDLFCSCGWVFNQHMPIEEQAYFAPWIYIPQFSIRRKKLGLIVQHLNPFYYRDMWGYLKQNFADNQINALYPNVVHYEIDGLIQRVIMADSPAQAVWDGIAKVEHMGFAGYNRGGLEKYEEMFDSGSFMNRVRTVEEFIADPYWRASVFGKEVVEREIGRELPKRVTKYKVTMPGGWESIFDTELANLRGIKRINSVPITPDMKIVVAS